MNENLPQNVLSMPLSILDPDSNKDECLVRVYIDDGRVFQYQVANPMKGREHAGAILKGGYRHAEGQDLEWYPVHRIQKVVVNGAAESDKYKDVTVST